MAAGRFASKNNDNLTLYYTVSETSSLMSNGDNKVTGIIVASEPLNDYKKDWVEIEPNSILLATKKDDYIEFKIESIGI
jgi:predicted glutamine amidotransferase